MTVLNAKTLGEALMILGDDSTVDNTKWVSRVCLYKCPPGKRAIIKSVMASPLESYPDDPNSASGGILLPPSAGTVRNDLSLVIGGGVVIKSRANGTDWPKAIYRPNFSGGVLEAEVLEVGAAVILEWYFELTVPETFEQAMYANVMGAEVSI